MNLETLQEVVIDRCDSYKFIVANVTDDNDNSKLVVRVNNHYAIHAEILFILREEVRPLGLKACCIGGGRIEINPEAKTIRIWDKSTGFGEEPDRQQTIRMLQAAYPEFQVGER